MRKKFNFAIKIILIVSVFLIVAIAIFLQQVIPILIIGAMDLCCLGLVRLVRKTKHRRETHSFLFVFACYAVFHLLGLATYAIHPYLAILFINLGIGFAIGVFSHIFADQFNVRPMHLFYPLDMWLMKKLNKGRPRSKKIDLRIPTFFKIKTSTAVETSFIKRLCIIFYIVTGVATVWILIFTLEGAL